MLLFLIFRQKKSLHDLDNRDESEFAKLMYVYIRAGMLEAAQEVCEQSGHPWRAGNCGIFWHFLFIFAQGCLKQIKNIGYLLWTMSACEIVEISAGGHGSISDQSFRMKNLYSCMS